MILNNLKHYNLKHFLGAGDNRKGVTVLLVFVILTAITSISFALFNIVFGQLLISADIGHSFNALNAADEGIERLLYEDRVSPGNTCGSPPFPGLPPALPCFTQNTTFTTENAFPVGGRKCYGVVVNKATGPPVVTKLVVTGQYICNDARLVRRAFELNYSGSAGPSPLARWRMDETSDGTCAGGLDVCDTSGGGRHGDALPATPTIVDGIPVSGKARSFNGSIDSISLPDIGIGETPPFTVIAWFNPPSVSSGANTIYSEANLSNGQPGLDLNRRETQQVNVFYRNNAGTAISIWSTNLYSIDAWNQIVFVAESNSSFKLYLNGVLETTSTATISGLTLTNSNIGVFKYAAAPLGTNFFNGKIDEVTLYNTALTETQICDNFKTQSGQTNCGGGVILPINRWKLDDGPGLIAIDSAGTSNGNLINGPTWTTGKLNGALSFDGINDYVDTAAKAWGISNNFTVSAWIYATADTNDNNIWSIGNSGDYTNAGILGLRAPRQLMFIFYDPSSGINYERVYSPANAVPLNTWTHVAGVVKSGDLYVYINGVDVSSSRDNNSSVAFSDYSRKVFFGKWPTGDYFFTGKIDEVAMYGQALSSTQICELYKSQSGMMSCP